eukprot:TRINITY_DN21555_c0_g1_i1.p1 TRINITY_DN21555_c0_g1~~TRINITY_DN21555_c0_g1_i1.p1  ORF type:complete len:166 (+),score=15.03 TRINITY_DN21555_c0_g1_i1:45-500(+)
MPQVCRECGKTGHVGFRCPLRMMKQEEVRGREALVNEWAEGLEVVVGSGRVVVGEEEEMEHGVETCPGGKVCFSKKVSVTYYEASETGTFTAPLGLGSHARELPRNLSDQHHITATRFLDLYTPPLPAESIAFDASWPSEDRAQFIRVRNH